MIPVLFIGVPAFISFGLGWWGRGHWDKAGRKVDRLARLDTITAEEMARLERYANGEAK